MNNKNYKKPSEEELLKRLTLLQYKVTQESYTERPFENNYNDFHEMGLYVDIVSGEPLFTSIDKFNSGCGWPSFSKAITSDSTNEKEDLSHGMNRIEVRSKMADSHLGHLFNDGPSNLGGLRYCINSASLRFISFRDLDKEGYGEYSKLFEKLELELE